MNLTVGLKRIGLLLGITALLIAVRPFMATRAIGSVVPNRYVKLSDSVAGHTSVDYEIGFETSIATTLGSVEIEFCENDPFPGASCTVPAGFDISSAVLLTQSGTNDFSIDAGNTNAHKIVFSRTPGAVGTIPFTFEVGGVTNPSAVGTQYARIRLFSGAGMGGSVNEQAGVALSILGDLTVTTEVPPHIDLCVGVIISSSDCSNVVGDSIDMGILRTTTTARGSSQFIVGTNADNGYTVSVSGNSLTSGNNVLRALTSLTPSIIGTSQFGMNLRQNIAPAIGADPTGTGTGNAVGNYNIPDNFFYSSGDTIASAFAPDNYRKFTASYVVNIDAQQPAGYYATTITYIALGNF